MRVLWVVNGILPKAAEYLGVRFSNSAGWLIYLSEALATDKDIELHIAFPHSSLEKYDSFVASDICFHPFYEPSMPLTTDPDYLYDEAKQILNAVRPELLHIWGSEFVHAYVFAKNYNNSSRTVVSIQGIISEYAKVYFQGVPDEVVYGKSFRDFLKRDCLYNQQKQYEIRGKYEIRLFELVGNAIGRTQWDYDFAKDTNKDIVYYKCNEILREEFYESEKWNVELCEKHSIFISQMWYPIKGFHMFLQALSHVVAKYPDTKVYIAGKNIVYPSSIKGIIGMSYYAIYLRKMIRKSKLRNHLVFLGNLSAKQMVESMKATNVFVLPSLIENSPNSLGEAMLLGVPCVASNGGGTTSLCVDKEDSLIYPYLDAERLASCILRIFDDSELAKSLSYAATQHSLADHDPQGSVQQYLNVYRSMINE